MRSSRFTAALNILLLSLFLAPAAHACGPYYFLPRFYRMLRVDTSKEAHNEQRANCLAWQAQTSKRIPLEAIREYVYTANPSASNAFVRWIKANHRQDIDDYMALAKAYEHMSDELRSPWYYPSGHEEITADTLLASALAYRARPLADRYALLAIRAMRLLGRDSLCVAYYDSIAPSIRQETVRQLMLPYVYGALTAHGHEERALRYLPERNDLLSSMVRDIARLEEKIENIHMYREHGWWLREERDELPTQEVLALYAQAKQVITLSQTQQPEWHYCAAFLANLAGRNKEAMEWIDRGLALPRSGQTDESLRVLKMWVDAQMSPYDEAYMARLHKQLEWLVGRIQRDLTDKVVYYTTRGYNININYSYYYWNDMLRRIILGQVAPRLIREGETTRAMQLANMAEYALRRICVKEHKRFPELKRFAQEDGVQISDSLLVTHATEFYHALDTLPSGDLQRYYERLQHPRSAFDRFLARHSMRDEAFFTDIIGTQLLREHNYKEAAQWLARVPSSYQRGYGLVEGTDRLPFEAYKKQRLPALDYKYNFAREMAHLEEDISQQTAPDRRGLLMLRYGLGMKNQAEWCWGLTECWVSYYEQERPPVQRRRMSATIREGQRHIANALRTLRSREAKAQAHVALLDFKQAARYGETFTGGYVLRSCDRLVDYQAAQRIAYR